MHKYYAPLSTLVTFLMILKMIWIRKEVNLLILEINLFSTLVFSSTTTLSSTAGFNSLPLVKANISGVG